MASSTSTAIRRATTPAPARPASARLIALDRLRGLALVAMVVHHLTEWLTGDARAVLPGWRSFTVTDVAAPAFFVAAGAAAPLSAAGGGGRGVSRPRVAAQILRRYGLLVPIGLGLDWLLWRHPAMFGVLEALGATVVVGAALAAAVPARWLPGLAAGTLAGGMLAERVVADDHAWWASEVLAGKFPAVTYLGLVVVGMAAAGTGRLADRPLDRHRGRSGAGRGGVSAGRRGDARPLSRRAVVRGARPRRHRPALRARAEPLARMVAPCRPAGPGRGGPHPRHLPGPLRHLRRGGSHRRRRFGSGARGGDDRVPDRGGAGRGRAPGTAAVMVAAHRAPLRRARPPGPRDARPTPSARPPAPGTAGPGPARAGRARCAPVRSMSRRRAIGPASHGHPSPRPGRDRAVVAEAAGRWLAGARARPGHPRGPRGGRLGWARPPGRRGGRRRAHRRRGPDRRPGPPRDRRGRPGGDPRVRRHPHALRRPGHLGPGGLAVQLARRHHRGDGQLRGGVRPGAPRPPRLADPAHGGRRGHSRHGPGRGHHLELGDVPRVPGRARPPAPGAGRERDGPARRGARLRNG